MQVFFLKEIVHKNNYTLTNSSENRKADQLKNKYKENLLKFTTTKSFQDARRV